MDSIDKQNRFIWRSGIVFALLGTIIKESYPTIGDIIQNCGFGAAGYAFAANRLRSND